MYVDVDGLQSGEASVVAGDDIAEEGIKFLQTVNFGDQAKFIRIAAE